MAVAFLPPLQSLSGGGAYSRRKFSGLDSSGGTQVISVYSGAPTIQCGPLSIKTPTLRKAYIFVPVGDVDGGSNGDSFGLLPLQSVCR